MIVSLFFSETLSHSNVLLMNIGKKMTLGNYYDKCISCLVIFISQKMCPSDYHWPCILEARDGRWAGKLNTSTLLCCLSPVVLWKDVSQTKMWNSEREWILLNCCLHKLSFIQDPLYPCLMYFKDIFPKNLFNQEKENSYVNKRLTANFKHKSCHTWIGG